MISLAVRKSVPALVNYILVLYKQSSFLFIIGVPVLLAQAQIAGYQSFRYLEPYTMAGLLYVLLNLPILFLANRFVDATSLEEPRQGARPRSSAPVSSHLKAIHRRKSWVTFICSGTPRSPLSSSKAKAG